jgi:formiminoglutamate deiminase
LRAVAPEELNALVQLSAAGPIHLHIAEQVREVSECEAWSGQRPVAHLLATQPVDTRWCLVHATHMNRDETLRLARSGAVAGLCPITEANLGDGLFPVREFSAAGGAFGVGSDSNVAIAANAELRLLEYGQRLQERARNVFGHATAARHTGRALFDGAVRGGAQALGVAAGITLGAPADVIALASEHACFSGRSGDAVIDSWIFAGDARCIDRVWRAGERVVNGGQHRDHAAITARYRATLEAVLNA